jgi:hypothetical protein
MKNLNMVFLHMFEWFIKKYGKTTTKDREVNRQWMAAEWHPTNGFEPLATRLFIGSSYASAARYPMREHNVINIGLHVIKRYGMYSKEYKNWTARESKSPPIVKTIDSFKEYWSGAIALVNQMAAPASQHGYGMAAVVGKPLIASYNETLTNFGAAYAAMQETIKSQATSQAAMQGQLANIQQFCMAVSQQPPSNIYAPTQHQRTSNNRGIRRDGKGQGGGGSGRGNQQPTWYAPTPYKRWENWNYCHMHGSDIEDCHTSVTCGKPGPTHNPHATRANMMGGSAAGMHKMILPLVSGCTAPNRRPQQQQLSHQCRPIAHYPAQGTTWQQAPPPAHFSGMPPAGGS